MISGVARNVNKENLYAFLLSLSFFSSLPLSSLPLEIKCLKSSKGSGECCELPQKGLGHTPAEINFAAL